MSGGVDSAVCTALLNAALGPENVIALHIDNGFMRKDESKAVKESLEALGLHLHCNYTAPPTASIEDNPLLFFTSCGCFLEVLHEWYRNLRLR